MKRSALNIVLSCVILSSLFLVSCSKDTDNKKEWGEAVIYMPQAAMLNGGTNHNYPVPLNNNPSTRNYIVDTPANTLKIVLGVSRSGLKALEGFTVRVESYVDTTNQIVASGAIANAVLLPQGMYSLPPEVTVNSGERDAVFYLTVDWKKMKDNATQFRGKKLLLTVGINNPSKSELVLSQSLRKTVVVLDANTFL